MSGESVKWVDYVKPKGGITEIYSQAVAKLEPEISEFEKAALTSEIKALLRQENAVLIAHYYTDPAIQTLAEATGGCVADSLEMARFGRDAKEKTLIVAGVRFMGETAKILSPEKRVLMADLDATCSLDLGCPAGTFSAFCDKYPDRTVVVYANTSAAVKARADWVVTSAVGIDIVKKLHQEGKKILWGPDKHLGNYIQAQTGADMVIWQGNCIVHDEFKADSLKVYREQYPQAIILAHPESPTSVLAQADIIGSTSQLIEATKHSTAETFIVATDKGIFYKMQQAVPHKKLLIAPTAGESATCKSCAMCPWMAMNTLTKLKNCLAKGHGEVTIEERIRLKAKAGLDRMLAFAETEKLNVKASGSLENDQALFKHIGPA